MLEKKFAVGIVAPCLAILNGGKFGSFFEPPAQIPGKRSPLINITAPDGNHEQARNDAFLDLIYQNLLLGAWMGRQEKGHVGGKPAVPDNCGTCQHRQEPDQENTAGNVVHLPPTGSMLITERSPSACRYSILRTCPLLPVTTIRCTSAAIF